MSPHTLFVPFIAAVTAVTAVVGATITYLAFRAANREASKALRLFGYGFGTITLGLFVGGSSWLVFGLDGQEALLVQGLLVAPGFVLLLRSLYILPRTTKV